MKIDAIIANGASVSGDIDLRQRQLLSIFVPVITSGDLLVQGNFDTTSGNFGRLMATAPNTSVRFPVGAGSCHVLWPQELQHTAYLRLETSVAQGAERTFNVITKP